MWTVVISGAAGFLGSHLVRRLVADGHRVVALVRTTSSRRRLATVANQILFYDIDIVDIEVVLQQLQPIDAIIHTATDYGRQDGSMHRLVETNVLWGVRLAEAAARTRATCFINAGTALTPEVSPYALSKRQFSEWGRWLAEQHQLRFVDVALEHMYGEDDNVASFVTFVIVNCLRQVERLPLTAGAQMRDFIYIDDVVAALVRLLELFTDVANTRREGNYLMYPLGSGVAVAIREVVEMIKLMTRSDIILDFGALPYRPREVMFSQADISALCALGWRPQFTLGAGIERTVAWCRTHLEEIGSCAG